MAAWQNENYLAGIPGTGNGAKGLAGNSSEFRVPRAGIPALTSILARVARQKQRKLPPAAMAAGWLDSLALHQPWVQQKYPHASVRLKNYELLHICSHGDEIYQIFYSILWGKLEQDIPMWMNLLTNWRGLFASEGMPYTSLNKTLMNLPRQIPLFLLRLFPCVRLERPVVDRTELLLILAFSIFPGSPNKDLIMHARRNDILRAIDILNRDHQANFSWRKGTTYRRLAASLAEYPEVYEGNIAGLTSRAIQYRDELTHNRRRQQVLVECKPEDPTALPPIPLPIEHGITFLQTVDDLDKEGTTMNHCVLSYAPAAVRGDCFLFHIEYADEKATVEVSPNGHVVQAKGPRNAMNKACEWGSAMLADWAKQLPPPPKKTAPKCTEIEAPF